jgi:hypothetical protein
MVKENMNLDERDLAIAKIKENMKKMDTEMQNVYTRLKKDATKDELANEVLKEYETSVKNEEQIKKKQIKKLKELYNYINRQNNKNKNTKNTNTKSLVEEDKNAILKEITQIEHLMRK